MFDGDHGYGDHMRFKLGLAVGLAAGYWAASMSNEERRRQLEEIVQRIRENPRVQHVSETVTRDARRIGDAVESRLVAGADVAADAIAGSVETEPGAGKKSRETSGEKATAQAASSSTSGSTSQGS